MSDEFEYEDGTPGDKTSESTPSVQDQVNNLVSVMVEGADGKWTIPEDKLKGVPEAIVYAAKAEKRFRDTQSSFTKSRQRLKELETVNTELTEHVIKNATMHLTDEERDELDDLRTSNPEAWRSKLNEHEQNAKALQSQKVDEFRQKGKQASESEMRQVAYADFTTRTGIELSDEVINNQLPASYTKKLESNEWTFEQFLAQTEQFLKPSVNIKGAKDNPANPKSFDKLPGGREPSDDAQLGDLVQSYAKETY